MLTRIFDYCFGFLSGMVYARHRARVEYRESGKAKFITDWDDALGQGRN